LCVSFVSPEMTIRLSAPTGHPRDLGHGRADALAEVHGGDAQLHFPIGQERERRPGVVHLAFTRAHVLEAARHADAQLAPGPDLLLDLHNFLLQRIFRGDQRFLDGDTVPQDFAGRCLAPGVQAVAEPQFKWVEVQLARGFVEQ
jgi:hypothetical protein